jgi:hypothetical protein
MPKFVFEIIRKNVGDDTEKNNLKQKNMYKLKNDKNSGHNISKYSIFIGNYYLKKLCKYESLQDNTKSKWREEILCERNDKKPICIERLIRMKHSKATMMIHVSKCVYK